jgi:hypothetical protein
LEITLRNTEEIVKVDGVRARIWQGTTSTGIEVVAFVTRLAVRDGQGNDAYDEFEKELREVTPPCADAQYLARAFDPRLIL